MAFSLTKEQIEKLNTWKSSLNDQKAIEWASDEEHAEKKINELLEKTNFKGGNDLTAEQLDEFFHLLRSFSNNRNLSNLLYRSAGLKTFNLVLRSLYYSNEPLYCRIDNMFKLKGMGAHTISQFLVAFDSTAYPLATKQTKEMLDLEPVQWKAAQEVAISKFEVGELDKLYPDTLELLRDFVVFEEIKRVLHLNKYTQVNNLIWFWRQQEGSPEPTPSSAKGDSRSKLVFGSESFTQKVFGKEEDFENEIEQNAKLVFGDKTTYYPLKRKLGQRICDAFLYDNENDRLLIVENELQSHDLYAHIVPQIIDFFNAMKEEDIRNKVKHDIDWKDEENKRILRAIDYKQYDVLVVMDNLDFDIIQASNNISKLLTKFLNAKEETMIKFMEVNIYENFKNQKIFRIREL